MGSVTGVIRDAVTGFLRNMQAGEVLGLAFGGTGATTAAGARTALAVTAAGTGSVTDGSSHAIDLSWSGSDLFAQVDASNLGRVHNDANRAGSIASDSSYAVQRETSGRLVVDGSSVVTTDASGVGTVQLGLTMAAACFARAQNGDYTATGLTIAGTGGCTASSFKFFLPNGASTTIRVNWRAWGRWK